MFASSTFISSYVATDKRLLIKDIGLNKVGGFNVCQFNKAMTEGKQVWINLMEIRIILDFASEADAKQALLNLHIAIETLSPNCVVSGGVSTTFTFTQTVPATVWNIPHGLGKYPSVMIVDTSDNVFMGEIQYIDNNNITLTFTSAIDGKAYLN